MSRPLGNWTHSSPSSSPHSSTLPRLFRIRSSVSISTLGINRRRIEGAVGLGNNGWSRERMGDEDGLTEQQRARIHGRYMYMYVMRFRETGRDRNVRTSSFSSRCSTLSDRLGLSIDGHGPASATFVRKSEHPSDSSTHCLRTHAANGTYLCRSTGSTSQRHPLRYRPLRHRHQHRRSLPNVTEAHNPQ